MSDQISERVTMEDISKPDNFDYEGATEANKEIADKEGGKELLGSGSELSVAILNESAKKAKLEHENVRDPLTGVHNRGYWNSVIEGLKPEDSYTVIMIDIDNFKSVNDTYGHAAGDKILVSIARLIDNHVKLVGFGENSRDIVARYGGEEFAILLLNLNNPEVALKRAEEIREAASKLIVNHSGIPVERTLSLGVAVHKLGDTADQTVELADKALYVAKENGKNRVVI